MSTRKVVASNSVMMTAAEIINKLLRIVLVVYIARTLGDSEYGKFSFARAFVSIFVIMAEMGLHPLLIRELARSQKMVKKYLANTLFLKGFLSVITFTVILIITRLTCKPPEVQWTILIFAVNLIVSSYVELFRSVFQAFQKMKYDAFLTFFESLFTTVVGMLVLAAGGDMRMLALVFLATSILACTYCVIIVQKFFTPLSIEFDKSLVRLQIKEALPFGLNFYFSTIYTFGDSVILAFLCADNVVGWYNAAYRLVFVLIFISTGVMKAVYPALSDFFVKDPVKFRKLFDKTFKLMFFLGVSCAAGVSLLSKPITAFLYGDQFTGTPPAMVILMWALACIFMTTVMTYTVSAANRQRFTTKVVGVGALLNIGLNFLLIPRYAHIGAALATLLTEGMIFVSHALYLGRMGMKAPLLAYAPKIVAANLAMAGAGLALRSSSLLLAVPACVAANILVVWLLRFFTEDEIQAVKALAGNWIPGRRGTRPDEWARDRDPVD
jgi:O-antigen/teichoic acid export membrane protein